MSFNNLNPLNPVNNNLWNQSSNILFGNSETGTKGALMPGIQAATGMAQALLGYKQYGLMKDKFNFQKSAFTQNYNQQANDYNMNLKDRQLARLSANPDGYQSVGDYMGAHSAKQFGKTSITNSSQQPNKQNDNNYKRLPLGAV